MPKNILAIDQGTSSTRAIIFDSRGNIVKMSAHTHGQSSMVSAESEVLGLVEQDGEEIWQNTLKACKEVCADGRIGDIVAVGITNQRETLVTWDAKTHELLAPVIVWQDRRSADLCKQWIEAGLEPWVQQKTGLLLDPYFSATKMHWLLQNNTHLQSLIQQKRLRFGTIDTFLLWRLTGGKSYATDVTNASRTLLMNLHSLRWDEELLSFFGIDRSCLPEILESTADFGMIEKELLGKTLPITAMVGDQQAALVGQACFQPGMAKSTYGTGCFLLINTGDKPIYSQHRLLTTVAYSAKGERAYGLEGSIFAAGVCMQWLRDTLKFIDNANDAEQWARQIDDTGGVYLVPAFTGLGAPYWDPWARGAIVGLTRHTGIAHIIRAALEAVCYQTADLLATMALEDADIPTAFQDATRRVRSRAAECTNTYMSSEASTQQSCSLKGEGYIHELRVDGGMTANTWLLQFLADILNCTIKKPHVIETTALGAAYLAGLQVGIYDNLQAIAALWSEEKSYQPEMTASKRDRLYQGWRLAVRRVLVT